MTKSSRQKPDPAAEPAEYGALARIDRIEQSLTARGHLFQDNSTIKFALLDLLGVVRHLATQIEQLEKRTPHA